MPSQSLVDPKVAKRYRERMALVELNGNHAANFIVEYWWNLWLIYADKDYLAEYSSLDEWLRDLSHEAYGPSPSTFHNKRRMIEVCVAQGMKEPGIRHMLLHAKVAIELDMVNNWLKPGTTEFKDEIEEAIRAGGETPVEALQRIAKLSSKDARREVAKLAGHSTEVFFSNPTQLSGGLLCDVTLMEDDQFIGTFTLSMKTRMTRPKPSDVVVMPDEILQALTGRLGLRL